MKPFGARHRSFGAWLAIAALALQALWPLIAQAKPRSVTLVPICTVGGETHYVELETGGGDASHEEHCKACPVGAAALASGSQDFFLAATASSAVSAGHASAVDKRFVAYMRSRAPPSFLPVDVNPDLQETKDEEAIAVRHRGARDALAGRGVVRRGVLLG